MNKKAGTKKSDVGSGTLGETQRPDPIFATLEPIIGRLMTLGKTIGGGADDAEIAASDIYEWGPGGFFVLHSAYGVMGEMGVGGIEMIGLDASGKAFRTWFFDNQGKLEEQKLSVAGDTWTWEGEATRCTGTLSADGYSMDARHERRSEDGAWTPSMRVIACADFTVAGVLRTVRKTDLMKPFPKIEAYYARCFARPAWQRTLSLSAERLSALTPTLTQRVGQTPTEWPAARKDPPSAQRPARPTSDSRLGGS